MDLNLLEDFLCLARVRSFSRAADLRNVTQSTLSKRIRALEHWLGAEVVDRSQYPISLTPAGAALVAPTGQIVQMVRGLQQAIQAARAPGPDELILTGTHTLQLSFMPALRQELEARIGPLQLTPIHPDSDYAGTLRGFRNGDADLLLTYRHPSVAMALDAEDFETLVMAQERCIPVSAPGPDGLAANRIRPGRVLRYLSYGNTSFFGTALAHMLADRPLALDVVATNAMSAGLRSLALVGGGLAWLPESLVRADLAAGRLVRGADPDWEFAVDIVLCRARANARPVVARVWDTALALADQGQGLLGRDVLV